MWQSKHKEGREGGRRESLKLSWIALLSASLFQEAWDSHTHPFSASQIAAITDYRAFLGFVSCFIQSVLL